MKLIKILCLLSFLLFSCKNNQEVKSSPKNEAYLDVKIDDTLTLNQIKKIKIRFAHPNFDDVKTNEEDLKIVSGCVIFSTEDKLTLSKKEFDIKCDSIYHPSVGVNDTVSFKFNYKPTKLGKNYLLLKLKEKNYLNPHKDSIRMVDYDFFVEKEFFVTEDVL